MVEFNDDFEIKKQGWLQKQSSGRRWFRNWKKRFCQAKVKGQEKFLVYNTISKKSEYKIRGSVDLLTVSHIRRAGTSTKPQFELVCPKRTWVFECSDFASRESWVMELDRIIWGIRDERLPSTKAIIETRDTSISAIFAQKEEEVDLYGADEGTLSVDVNVLKEQLSPSVALPESMTKKERTSLEDMWAQTLKLMEGSDGFLDVYASEDKAVSPRFSLGS